MFSRVREFASDAQLIANFVKARVRARRADPPAEVGPRSSNALFDRAALGALAQEKAELESFSPRLYARLNEPRLLGQLVFEYATLANAFKTWRGSRVLDIGSGQSSFPLWMASRGAEVHTLELNAPAEGAERTTLAAVVDSCYVATHRARVKPHVGTMFDLPFPTETFEVVTSLSVIEHVDTAFPERTYVPYEQQKIARSQALSEMIRVTRRGGLVYLTSDCCDFARATSDAWRPYYYYRSGPALSGAWPVADVPELFYEFVRSKGCELVGPLAFDRSLVNGSERYETFRGKYWSAFCLLARKLEPKTSGG